MFFASFSGIFHLEFFCFLILFVVFSCASFCCCICVCATEFQSDSNSIGGSVIIRFGGIIIIVCASSSSYVCRAALDLLSSCCVMNVMMLWCPRRQSQWDGAYSRH
eukprot:234825_1